MNYQKLRIAEAYFLQTYPDGFADPALIDIGKRHNIPRMQAFAKEVFAKKSFDQPNTFLENLTQSCVPLFDGIDVREAEVSRHDQWFELCGPAAADRITKEAVSR